MSIPLNLVTLGSLPVIGASVSKSELVKTVALPALSIRGRKPGVRTVSYAISNHRRAWLSSYTKGPGMKAKLGEMLKASDSLVSHLLSGRRTFTNNIARHIEEVLGLVPGTIDATDLAAKETISQQSPDSKGVVEKSVLDANLAKVLVDFLNEAILKNRVTNEMAIRILVDIAPS